ncbi:MAG: N-formylglutamate amidohydrolase [Panacagrimonas sp.]
MPQSNPSDEAPLLAADEPAPFQVERESGRSPFFFNCDHAGTRIPRALNSLGLPDAQIQRHIGWDIGIAAVARQLSELLDATLILQPYSRLVIDCNRPPQAPDSIAAVSDGTAIPGNQALTSNDCARRREAIFHTYHAAIRRLLDARLARGQPTLLIALHSFTPELAGVARPWHAGLLYKHDDRLARALGEGLRAEPELVVGDNEPYALDDAFDFSVPEHGERRGLPHLELEIRQDLIADAPGQAQWAQRLARILRSVPARLI